MNSVAAFVIVPGLSFSFILLFMLFKITAIQTHPSYCCANEKRSSDNRYEVIRKITHCLFNSVRLFWVYNWTRAILKLSKGPWDPPRRPNLIFLAANIDGLRSFDELSSRTCQFEVASVYTLVQCFRLKTWLCRQAMKAIHLSAVEKSILIVLSDQHHYLLTSWPGRTKGIITSFKFEFIFELHFFAQFKILVNMIAWQWMA